MSRNTKELPIREKHTRAAKEKASIEITKYFKPKKPLQVIPENDEILFQKQSKHDKNNNTAKRPLKVLGSDTSTGQKKQPHWNSTKNDGGDSKRKKVITSTPVIQNGGKSTSNGSISASDDIVVVLDSSIDTNNSVLVDSSVASSAQSFDQSKRYDFDALQTDDATEYDEDESNAPYWSLYRNRIAIVNDQVAVNLKTIDQFFGCKFENVDSIDIFPATVPIARRRSTAVWNTPPRYSILPKY